MFKSFDLNPASSHLVNAVSSTGLFIPQGMSRFDTEVRQSLVARLGRWLQRRQQRLELARLDARMLSDIGLTRADALAEALKPFWRD